MRVPLYSYGKAWKFPDLLPKCPCMFHRILGEVVFVV